MEWFTHRLPGDPFSRQLWVGVPAGPQQCWAEGRAGETSRLPKAGPAQLSGSKQLQVATKHERAGVSGRWQQILLQALGLWAPA